MLLDEAGVPIREGCRLVFDKKLAGDKNLLAGEVVEVKEGSLDPNEPQVKQVTVMVPYTFTLRMSAQQAPGLFVVGVGADSPKLGLVTH